MASSDNYSGVFHEPSDYGFKDRDGHSGKFFGTSSDKTNHLIIEVEERLTVSLRQNESEFNYYVVEGEGQVILNGDSNSISKGDLIVIAPGTKYTLVGKLKLLLINTPHWDKNKEEIFDES